MTDELDDALPPPPDLGEHGKAFWTRVLESFFLDPHNIDLLTQACQSLDLAAAARAQVAKDGLLMDDRFDQKKAHPLLAVERDAKATFRHLYKLLGLDGEERRSPGRPPEWTV